MRLALIAALALAGCGHVHHETIAVSGPAVGAEGDLTFLDVRKVDAYVGDRRYATGTITYIVTCKPPPQFSCTRMAVPEPEIM